MNLSDRLIQAHGTKYIYNDIPIKYKYNDKIQIICREHGKFKQRIDLHLRGSGCQCCALLSPKRYRKDINHFITKARKTHGDKYDYSKTEYKNGNQKVIIICREHGEFKQRAKAHIYGQKCPKCRYKVSTNDFITKARKVHGDIYNYSKVDYQNSKQKVTIICREHGEFKQKPNMHLSNRGCLKCGKHRNVVALFSDSIKFIKSAYNIHGDIYNYSKVDYQNSKQKVTIICREHGEFKQRPNDHLSGYGCPKCGGTHTQNEIHAFISSIIECTYNNKSVIAPYELDIYIPSKKFAIELNGVYWHSYGRPESSEERMKHVNKLELCKKHGIKLFQITDIEWHNKKELIKSMLMSRLGMSNSKYYARNCILIKPTTEQRKKFFDTNHIQNDKNSSYAIALSIDDKMVAMMSFNKHKKFEWEISRFAILQQCSVVGAASKLFNWFIKDNKPSTVLTYADRRFGEGLIYTKLGFEYIGATKPGYCYVKNGIIMSRQKFQKHKLKYKLPKFDITLSESQNMFNNKYRRLWDAGHNKYLYKHE